MRASATTPVSQACSPYHNFHADDVENGLGEGTDDGADDQSAREDGSERKHGRTSCCQVLIEHALYYITEHVATSIASCVMARKKWFQSMSDEVKQRVLSMDLICKFALLGVVAPNTKHEEVRDIWPPQEQTFFDDSNARYVEELGIWIPKEDEQPNSVTSTKTGVPEQNWKKLGALGMRCINDDLRPWHYFSDVSEGRQFSHEIRKTCLGQMRVHEKEQMNDESRPLYTSPDVDAVQGDLAYFGLGQVVLAASDNPQLGDHMCDLRAMGELEVRPAFERYGACAYFKYPARQISCIYWCHGERLVYPVDDDWEHAKWVWRCSLFLWSTAVFHLVHTHWIVSNAVTTSVRGLPPVHPIRRLMHINTFGNAKVNQESLLALRPRHALLHHACALKYDSLQEVFITGAQDWRYQTLPDMMHASTLPDAVKQELPIFADGMKFWKTFHKFYQAYVDIYYQDDAALLADQHMARYWSFECVPQYRTGLPPLSKQALVDQLTHSCFHVSVYHQLVGDVIRYLKMPNSMVWHIREGQDMADAKAMLLTMNIATKTMRDMPELIGDEWFFDVWAKHLIVPEDSSVQQQLVKQLLSNLKIECNALRAVLEEQNRHRPDGTRPEFWACSVSL